MPRAYVHPKTIVKSLQYMNPNDEVLTTTKNLLSTDSPIQKLDPEDNNIHVVLPNPIDCNGMFFQIINASTGIGVLRVYDHTNSVLLTAIDPGVISQFNCITDSWKYYLPLQIIAPTPSTRVNINHNSSFTITTEQGHQNILFTNHGATGDITATLPVGEEGMIVCLAGDTHTHTISVNDSSSSLVKTVYYSEYVQLVWSGNIWCIA